MLIYSYFLGMPGSSWDRVNFLTGSWYIDVFWISYENNLDNTLTFQLLLSRISPKPMIFQFPTP